MRDLAERLEETPEPERRRTRAEAILTDYIRWGALLRNVEGGTRCRRCGRGEVIVTEVHGLSDRPLVIEWCPDPSCGWWC